MLSEANLVIDASLQCLRSRRCEGKRAVAPTSAPLAHDATVLQPFGQNLLTVIHFAMSRISRIDIYTHNLTYAHGEYVMSGGRTIRTLLSTIVKVTTESGVEGFGEVCPLGSNYLPGYGNGASSVIAEIAHSLVGLEVENLNLINHTMDAVLSGHGYAKSAIDIACWDAYGKHVGQWLYTSTRLWCRAPQWPPSSSDDSPGEPSRSRSTRRTF